MTQTVTEAVAQPEQFLIKPSTNPDAYYDYPEAETLGYGKYLKLRRAVKSGKLKAFYSGRNVRFKGSDLINWLEGKSAK